MSVNEIRWLPKICEHCGVSFPQIVGTAEKYCSRHRTVTLPAYVQGPTRVTYHTKEIQWAKMPEYLQ